MRHDTKTTRDKMLLLGWTVGPFVLTLVTVGMLTALKWPKAIPFGGLIQSVPILAGMMCFVMHTAPRGLQWLILLPYAIGYFVMDMGVFIVAAILAGAPK